MSGRPVAAASALAVITPTSTPPIRPGPAVTAMASSSGRPAPASCQRALDDEVGALGMGAGGDLGHDAAEAVVQVGLAEDGVREDAAGALARAGDDGGRGLVAARFDAEDGQGPCLLHASRR